MTREQAIEVLKLVDENASCDDCLYYAQMEDCPTDEDCIIRQAFDMAIQALQAQADGELVISTDLLLKDAEREKLRQELLKQKEDGLIVLPWYCKVAIPSAEPKTGHWIECDGWDGDVYYECSVCSEPFVLIDGTPADNLYNYCPNCGSYNGGE